MGEYNELYHHGVKGQKWGVRRTPAQLGHRTAGQNTKSAIVFKKHNNYYLGATKFGGNPKCEFRIRNAKDGAVANRIANDRKLESSTRKVAVDKLYEKQNEDSSLSKTVFSKQVRCYLVDVGGDFNAKGVNADTAVHYECPTGDTQSILIDSKSHAILYP